MAIGTTAAILGAAAIGAGGSFLAAKSQSKANSQAAQVQNNATDAQLQLGRESLAMNQGIYNSNYDVLSPYVSRGNVAGDAINALLGLPAAPAMRSPMAGAPPAAAPAVPPTAAPQTGAPMSFTPGAVPSRPMLTGGNQVYNTPAADARPAYAQAAIDRAGALAAARGLPATPPATPATPAAPVTPRAPAAGTPAASPTSALTNFANSAGMQFALAQGADMINNRYAASGALQSGAAMKALQAHGQNIALQQYFPMYTGLLQGQQSVGAGAASSIAGVGANFGNTAANINAGMGNAINSGAQNIGNLALANGQNQANMWGNIGGSIAGAIGGLGSSYGSAGGYNGRFANPAF